MYPRIFNFIVSLYRMMFPVPPPLHLSQVQPMPPGRKTDLYYRKYNKKIRWRNRIRRRKPPAPRPADTFQDDKRVLMAKLDVFLDEFGKFINTHSENDMERIAFDWNRMIWQPRRQIVDFVANRELWTIPVPVSPKYVFPRPFIEPPPSPESPPPVLRRARRPFKPYNDTAAQTTDERCKICMINKKVVGFFPCGHVGICNECCRITYNRHFRISNKTKRPILVGHSQPAAPEPPAFNFENEEEFIEQVINELTRPRFHCTQKCVFCKDRIDNFQIVYSI